MSQYDLQISDFERIFRKQYKIILLCMVLSIVFCIFFARMKVPLYKTAATVKIDRSSVMGIENSSMIYGTWDNIETQTRVIKSFPVLLRTAKILNIIPDSLSDEVQFTEEKTLAKIMGIGGRVSTTILGGTNIVEIAATSSDPAEARNIANAVAYSYKEYSITGKKLHATKTKEFIQAQLTRCQEDLERIENQMRIFEERQKIPLVEANAQHLVDESGKYADQIKGIDDAITLLKLEEENLKNWSNKNYNKTLFSWRDSGKSNGAKNARIDSFMLARNMEWISQITDQDPGLIQLNNRLIQLQIDYEDQRSFYKVAHPALKDIDGKIRTTIEQILNKYRSKIRDMSLKRLKYQELFNKAEQEIRALPTNEMEYARLKRQLDVAEKLNSELTTRLQEAMIADVGVVDDVTIMSLATLPYSATNKNVATVVGIGLFLGFFLGVVFAVLREIFDTSISTIKDVERTLKMIVLAVIPHIESRDSQQRRKRKKSNKSVASVKDVMTLNKNNSVLVTHFNPRVPAAEAYRILRTNIEYLLSAKPLKTILLTSATMQEGKSTTIANLGVVFAQQGKQVLILELNLRRPSLRNVFGYDHGPGVTDVIMEKTDWRDCLISVTDLAIGAFTMEDILHTPGLDNLYILPYGQTPANPTELISSSRMDDLLLQLRDQFDLILVDGPPLLPVADSIIISKKVDGVILVYMVGRTPRNSLRLTKDRLIAVQANILGLVLNGIRPETTGTEYASYALRAYTEHREGKKEENRAVVLKSRLHKKEYDGTQK